MKRFIVAIASLIGVGGLLFLSLSLAGVFESPPGSDPNSLPLHTVSYGERHTYPIVFNAVMPLLAEAEAVFALELNSGDISLAKIVEEEFSEPIRFVPRSQVTKKAGRFTDVTTGTPARVLTIMNAGGKRDRLNFKVKCDSGTGSVSYEVVLLGSERTFGWQVAPPKKL